MNEIITLTKKLRQTDDVMSAKALQSDLLRCYHNLPARKIENIISMKDHTTIASIERETSEFQLNALLYFIVNYLVNFFNVGKTMNASQIQQTVALIRETYPYLMIEDFKICFNDAKKGLYGKLYDRIDGQIILDWLDRYDNRRACAFQDYNDNRAVKEPESPRTCRRIGEVLRLKEVLPKNLK